MKSKQMDGVIQTKKFPIVVVLITGSFLAILNQTLLVTAIPHIMADLQLTENTAQWLTTIFMLVNGIMIPITAFLMETFTTRKLFITSMSVFAIGTFVCSVATSFSMLMIGRIIQATGAGILMPLMMTIFILIFPIERRGTAMGTVGLVISFAPALGPALSGWLIQYYHWRSLFIIVLPLTVIDIIIAYFVLRNVITRTFPKVDMRSIILSTFGFGGLLYGFSSAGNYGWLSPVVISTLAIGSVSLTAFILRQFKLVQPVLEFRVFTYKTFAITTVIGMIGFMGLIAAETILPIYMQIMAGFTPLESGMMILPGALLMGLMSPINGRIFDLIGARWLLITGLSIMTITTFMFTNLTATTSLAYLTIVFAFRMIGISMVLMPATTAGLNQLPNRLIPHGTAMNNTMRQVAASIGTAMLITIMTSAALPAGGEDFDPNTLIRGVNVSFYIATILSLVALILSFYVKDKTPKEAHDILKAAGNE